eukprot:2279059-Prymnesium_polylepis.1
MGSHGVTWGHMGSHLLQKGLDRLPRDQLELGEHADHKLKLVEAVAVAATYAARCGWAKGSWVGERATGRHRRCEPRAKG